MLSFGIVCLIAIGVVSGRPNQGVSSGSASSVSTANGGTFGTSYTSTSGLGSQSSTGTYGPGFSYSTYPNGQQSYRPYQQGNRPNSQFQNAQTSPFASGQLPFPSFPSPFQAAPFFPNIIPPFQPLNFAPLPPILTPPEFNQALSQYLNSIQQQYATNYNGGSFAYSSPGATAYAYSSLGPSKLYDQQQQLWESWKNDVGGPNQTPFYAPNYAAATGSYSPSSIHQTASLNPENPSSPNVDTRFESSGTEGGSPGFVGVQTASFSTSSDINGVKTNRKGAITSVNENGKVTTYKVES